MNAELKIGPAAIERKCTAVAEDGDKGKIPIPVTLKSENSVRPKEKKRTVRIYLRMLVGKMITIQCLSSAKIAEVKAIIELSRGFPRSEQRIFWSGDELEDSRCVADADAYAAAEGDAGKEGVINMELRLQPIKTSTARIGVNDSLVLNRYL